MFFKCNHDFIILETFQPAPNRLILYYRKCLKCGKVKDEISEFIKKEEKIKEFKKQHNKDIEDIAIFKKEYLDQRKPQKPTKLPPPPPLPKEQPKSIDENKIRQDERNKILLQLKNIKRFMVQTGWQREIECIYGADFDHIIEEIENV